MLNLLILNIGAEQARRRNMMKSSTAWPSKTSFRESVCCMYLIWHSDLSLISIRSRENNSGRHHAVSFGFDVVGDSRAFFAWPELVHSPISKWKVLGPLSNRQDSKGSDSLMSRRKSATPSGIFLLGPVLHCRFCLWLVSSELRGRCLFTISGWWSILI